MDAKAKEPKLLEAVSLPLAQTEQLVDIVEVTPDQAQRSRIASDTSACIWQAKVLIMPGFYLPMV